MTSSEYKKHYRANRLLLITYYLTDKKDITVSDICLTHRYYYKAANLKKIGSSHIVQSYVMAAISSILNGNIDKALKILSEIEMKGNTVNKYKELVQIIINWVLTGF